MQIKLRKRIIAAAALAAAAALSSCSDISRTTVNIHTPAAAVTDEEEPEVTEPPEDDDDGDVQLILPENFVTTGRTEVPQTSVTSTERTKGTTTFPIQTARSQTETATAETTAEKTTAEETTPVVTTTAETTTSVTAAETTVTTTSETAAAAVPPETAAPAETSQVQMTAESGQINYNVIGDNGILVSYQNGHYRGLMACFGTYGLCDKWTNAVNTFAKKLPDVNVYTMAAPIPSEFYTPQSFLNSGFTVSQYNKCEHIRENVDGVTYVDAYSALAAHTDEDIYLRTDHHWTPLGAYYAAQAFAEAAGADFPSIDKYTPVSRSGYVGSMYTYSKDRHLYNDAETFTMYLSPNADSISTRYYNTYFTGGYAGDLFVTRNASAFYCSYLGSDDRIAEITTDVKNGRTLVVFKQSYGNALIPFLTSGFEKIYVCDMRYFDLNGVQFCKDVGATDLLCTDCVMVAAGNGGKYLEYVLNK